MRTLRQTLYGPLLSASFLLVKPSPCVAFHTRTAKYLPRLNSPSTTRLMSSAQAETETPPKKKQPIVQYIVLRRDLDWPAGAMAAQAAHASLAAVAQGLEQQHAPTQYYISPENLPHMTKYVYGVDTLEELEAVKEKWSQSFSSDEGFYWWVEQPENIPTAFATWPVERTNKVSKVVKNMKLSFF